MEPPEVLWLNWQESKTTTYRRCHPCLCWRIPSFVATLESKFSHPMTSWRRYRWYQEISYCFHCLFEISLTSELVDLCWKHSICIYSCFFTTTSCILLWSKTPLQLKEIPSCLFSWWFRFAVRSFLSSHDLQLEGKYWVNQQAHNANNQWLTHEIATWVANPRHFWRFITLS